MIEGLRTDQDSQYAALQERVYGLGQQFLHFEQATTRNFHGVEAALATLSTELRAGGKTQWQLVVTSVGVLVATLGALGTLAYLPVKTGMDQLATEGRALREAVVPRSEHVERWRRTDEDLRDLSVSARRLEDRLVPRGEHEERWRSSERRLDGLQRQVEEAKRVHSETFSPHDAFLALGRRLERLETAGGPQPPARP